MPVKLVLFKEWGKNPSLELAGIPVELWVWIKIVVLNPRYEVSQSQ